MRTRKPRPLPVAAAVRLPLYLSPAGLRRVRTRVAPGDRDRLAGLVADRTIRLVTKEPTP